MTKTKQPPPEWLPHQRLEGLKQIARYLGVGVRSLETKYLPTLKPYLFSKQKGKNVILFTYTNLLQIYLVERELETNRASKRIDEILKGRTLHNENRPSYLRDDI